MEHEIAPIFIIIFIAGLLTTGNVFTVNFDDMRWSLNDAYKSLMLAGWIFLIWGVGYQMMKHTIIGLMLLVISFYAIRTQFMITPNQYIKTMIPYNSMVEFMSKELLANQHPGPQLSNFANNVISGQQNQINLMKNLE